MHLVLGTLAESLGESLAGPGRTVLEQMAQAGEDFVMKAREFDPTLNESQLSQALRNLWIMNSIQVLLRRSPSLTPSVFAYSLLYPYTDNILDDPSLTGVEKRAFALRLGKRLSGGPDQSTPSAIESKTWSLISMIEEEWPRAHYPPVYASLLAIHAAQEKGAGLGQSSPAPASCEEITRVTFAKGGTSVLAHGFLLLGDLPGSACRWMFGYGTFLQLVDDLEDFEEDRGQQMATLFTTARQKNREMLIRRLLAYGDMVMRAFPTPSCEAEQALHHLIRFGYRFLVIQSVATHPATTGVSFARRLEAHSPLRFASLRSLRHRGRDLQSSKTLNMLPLRPRAAVFH